MAEAFVCDAIRTQIGRYGGALATIRTDDLASLVLRALAERNLAIDWEDVDDVVFGCANQAGEDNRNVARMAILLAGLGESVPGTTINRLCGSGMDAVAVAARAVKCGKADVIVAGGVESMSRAPFVLPKAESAFSRANALHDTTIGRRFVNTRMKAAFGVHSVPETAENIADEFAVSREDQDRFAFESQRRARATQDNGRFECEIVPVAVSKKGDVPQIITRDEHLRYTTLDALAALKPVVRSGGTVTAGNASGVNDGAAAMIIAREAAVTRYGLTPRARFVGGAVVGVPPRIMGIGPAPATRRLLSRHHLGVADMDVVELNEAFASQGLAVMRELGLPNQAEHVNRNGGAIALGHPLGMSGVRLVMTAVEEISRTQSKRALCAMCIGVGQGIATLFERV